MPNNPAAAVGAPGRHGLDCTLETIKRFRGAAEDNLEGFVVVIGQMRCLRQVVGDCHKLKIDVDHFNAERAADNPYHLVLDFGDDVAELEAASEAEKKKRA